MKQLLFLIFLLFSLHSYGQNLKKLLSAAEYDSVQSSRTVYKVIDRKRSKSFEGYEGTIGIVQLKNKLHYFFIGEAKRFGASGSLIATMKSDSLGYLLSYLETNSQDGVILDCVYEYKRINGKLYRIEKLKLYYGPDQLWEVGQRFLKMTDEGIGTRFASPHKAYGVWTYYTRSGEIEKTKDFGNLE